MKYFYIIAVFLFLLITNSQYLFEDDLTGTAAADTYSYKSIADNAPVFPISKIPYHHAQRFIIPYILGNIAHIFKISVYNMFLYATLFFIVGVLILVFLIIQTLQFSKEAYYISISLISFNPYVFRLYIAFVGMVTDLGFVFGLSLTCFALVKSRLFALLLGSFMMIISRQTGILALPGIICWLLFSDSWKGVSLKKKVLTLAALTFMNTIIYFLESYFAKGFSENDYNIQHITGIFHWFFKYFDFKGLFIFLVQGSIPYLMTIGLIMGFGRVIQWESIEYKELSLWLAFPFFICTQPYLGGPEITGGNITRLQAISIFPLITGIISELDKQKIFQKLPKKVIFTIICFIILSSFHHLFTGYGIFQSLPVLFVTLQFILALLAASILYLKTNLSSLKTLE